MHTIHRLLVAITFGATIAAAGTILTAPAAHADQFDYVNALDNHGVYYGSITEAIDIGKIICGRLRNGDAPSQLATTLANVNPGLAQSAAVIVVSAAHNNMCPDA